jgi:hypothetical protein
MVSCKKLAVKDQASVPGTVGLNPQGWRQERGVQSLRTHRGPKPRWREPRGVWCIGLVKACNLGGRRTQVTKD